jgi:hypothetical protein
LIVGGWLLPLSQPPTVQAQSLTNHVLQLDGHRSYVQLPPGIFSSLTQATVEAWMKCDLLREAVRFLDFGEKDHEMYVSCVDLDDSAAALKVLIAAPTGQRHRLTVPGLLTPNVWWHVAVVTGPGGIRLYFNGRLVGSDPYQGSFSTLGSRNNFLGAENANFGEHWARG